MTRRVLRTTLPTALGTLLLSAGLATGLSPLATASPAQPVAVPTAATVSSMQLSTQARAKLADFRARFGLIDPTQYQCDTQNPVHDWENAQVAKLSQADIAFLQETGADALPSLDAMFFGTSADPAYALGLHAHDLSKAMGRLRSFWDEQLPDVQLVAMHGTMLTDPARVSRIAVGYLGLTQADADAYAQVVSSYVRQSAAFDGGNWFGFSLGAFTVGAGLFPGLDQNKIVIGDGLLMANDAVGYDDVVAQFVLGHEFTHAVQIADGFYATLPARPEGTMYLELQADAGSAYFNSHPRGMSMQAKRIAEFAATAYAAGDCNFTSTNHHGTPNQRRAAALWGAQLQEGMRPKSRILGFQAFSAAYAQAYPALTAPDA